MHHLVRELVDIIWEGDEPRKLLDCSLSLNKRHNGYEIEVGQMYEYVGLNFAKLMKLSELFGTQEIDVDNYAQEGCESCDWGSSYTHTIQVLHPTKSLEALEELPTNKNLIGENA